jgi:hypothetical protein
MSRTAALVLPCAAVSPAHLLTFMGCCCQVPSNPMGQGVMEDTYSDRLDIMACCKGDYSLYNRCGHHSPQPSSVASVCCGVLGIAMSFVNPASDAASNSTMLPSVCQEAVSYAWVSLHLIMRCCCVHAGSCLDGCRQQSVPSYHCRMWQHRRLVGVSSTSRCGLMTDQSPWGSSRV